MAPTPPPALGSGGCARARCARDPACPTPQLAAGRAQAGGPWLAVPAGAPAAAQRRAETRPQPRGRRSHLAGLLLAGERCDLEVWVQGGQAYHLSTSVAGRTQHGHPADVFAGGRGSDGGGLQEGGGGCCGRAGAPPLGGRMGGDRHSIRQHRARDPVPREVLMLVPRCGSVCGAAEAPGRRRHVSRHPDQPSRAHRGRCCLAGQIHACRPSRRCCRSAGLHVRAHGESGVSAGNPDPAEKGSLCGQRYWISWQQNDWQSRMGEHGAEQNARTCAEAVYRRLSHTDTAGSRRKLRQCSRSFVTVDCSETSDLGCIGEPCSARSSVPGPASRDSGSPWGEGARQPKARAEPIREGAPRRQ